MHRFCWGLMPPFLSLCPDVLPRTFWAPAAARPLAWQARSLPPLRPAPRPTPAPAKLPRDVTNGETGREAKQHRTQPKQEREVFAWPNTRRASVCVCCRFSHSSPPSPPPQRLILTWFGSSATLLEMSSTLRPLPSRACGSASCTTCGAAGCSALAHPCSKFY